MNIPETSTQSHKRKVLFLYGLLFVFLSIILSKAPLISDDFEFADLALTNPKDLLHYALYYGNGRLMGNLTGIYLVNFPILCACFKAAVFCGVIFFLSRIIGKNSTLITALFFVLVLGASPDLMGQVMTWTSGWANFVPPILIGLICTDLVLHSNRFSVLRAAMIGILAVIGQLYVEHFTVIHILIAFTFLLVSIKQKDGTKRRYCIIWLTATIVGALIMLLLPKIFYLELNRTSGYRTFHLKDFVQHCSGALILMICTIANCTVLLAAFSIFGFCVNNNHSLLSKLKRVLYCTYPIIPQVYTLASGHASGLLKLALNMIQYGGFFFYILCILIDVVKLPNKQARFSMLLLIVLAGMSATPFLIITPFGERCLYLTYILLSIASVIGIRYCLENGLLSKAPHLKIACTITTVGFCILIGFSMLRIHYYDALRDTYIHSEIEKGSNEITIFHLPSKYAFTTYLPELYYYRDQPRDIQFNAVNLDEWLETHSFPND